MKKIALLATFSLFVIFTANAEWYIVTKNVNLRAGAGANYKVIGSIPKGSKFYFYSAKSGSWLKVQSFKGVGYISAEFLKVTQPPPDNGRRPGGISGLIGGTIGIIVVISIIIMVLRSTWENLTGRGSYKTGGYSPIGGPSSASPSKPYDPGPVNKGIQSNTDLASGKRPLGGADNPPNQ